MTSFVNSAESLGLSATQSDSDEAEIGIVLPRQLFDNNLEGLAEELASWDKHLRKISEIVDQNAASLRIRIVQTSALTLFLASTIGQAAAITAIIVGLTTVYKNILDIRLKSKELENLNVPKGAIKEIEKHEQKIVDQTIDQLVNSLMGLYNGDEGRKNELDGFAKLAVRFIANRIDRGATLEATLLIEEKPAATTAKTGCKKKKPVAESPHVLVRNAGHQMGKLEHANEPVLRIEDQSE